MSYKMVEIFVFTPANKAIETVKGHLLYLDWLYKEQKRISSVKGRHAEIRKRKKDGVLEFALFVNDVSC